MKKNEIVIVGILILLAVLWPQVANRLYKTPPVDPNAVRPATPTPVAPGGTNQVSSVTSTNQPGQVTVITAPKPLQTVTNTPATRLTGASEKLVNDLLEVTVSTVGASIIQARLLEYPQENKEESEPLVFDFASRPSLAYTGIPGLGLDAVFELKVLEPGRSVEMSTQTAQGLKLTRSITLGDTYLLEVRDSLSSVDGQALVLPKYDIQLGPVRQLPDVYAFGYTIGVDALLQRGEGVKHFGKNLQKWLKKSPDGNFDDYLGRQVDWIAVKNKFFCHLLTIKQGDLTGARDFRLLGTWNAEKKMASAASTAVQFEGLNVVPDNEYVREFTYFVGPKKLSELKKLPESQEKVMEFWGFLAPISKAVLWLMNAVHDKMHNYGIAIILLTLFIRILFWPLTHKSNESMKKMQALAPEMTELREKFKDNPQKQHDAVMGLYKKHKVNPLSGCLPMLIQFPVFIALFYVIRSAVELRFAPFLWISDLSEPEHILYATLNFPLNILPFAMAGTMFLQQRLTPTSADPAQQKIMQFFPIMLLFFLYNMPSGLLLYWTTSNVLMIAQQLHNLKKNKEAIEEGKDPAGPEHIPPPKPSASQGGSKKKKRKK